MAKRELTLANVAKMWEEQQLEFYVVNYTDQSGAVRRVDSNAAIWLEQNLQLGREVLCNECEGVWPQTQKRKHIYCDDIAGDGSARLHLDSYVRPQLNDG